MASSANERIAVRVKCWQIAMIWCSWLQSSGSFCSNSLREMRSTELRRKRLGSGEDSRLWKCWRPMW